MIYYSLKPDKIFEGFSDIDNQKIKKEEMMEEVKQDPRDCLYAIFVGQDVACFFPEKLTVIKKRKLDLGELIIEVVIIGESHYLVASKRNGQLIFVELLACIDLDELGFKPTKSVRVRDNASSVVSCVSRSIDIRSNICLHGSTSKRRSGKYLVLGQMTGELLLEKIFPGSCGPRTIVKVGWCGKTLFIKTYHEYATDDGEVVPLTTSTRVDIRLKGKLRLQDRKGEKR